MRRWFLLAFLVVSAARAASLEEAQALYAKGAFLEAANLAASLGNSSGFSFAARSLDEYAGEQPPGKREALYEQCQRFAERALALNPKNADAHFELGAAIGHLGSLRGAVYAFVNGVAGQVKARFERALELNPRLVLALVALGRWHAEIVSRGVAFLFGGSGDTAVALFERAVAADERSIFARLEYARALLVLDPKANRSKARAWLEAAVSLEPRDYLERRQAVAARQELLKLQ